MSSLDNAISNAVTTIIPTYRRPHLVKRAVLSALEQDGVPVQVSVFDNASGDETESVIAELARKDIRLRYQCHKENIGPMANFEFGLRSVQSPYFSILSDDDYLLPGFYARALSDLAKYPQAMFWAGLTLNVDETGSIWDARVARWPREGLFMPPDGVMCMMRGLAPLWTGIVFRREVLQRVGMPDREALGPSDLDFILRTAVRFPFLISKQPVAVFTYSSTSYSATQPLSSFWPGWKRMIENLSGIKGLDPSFRNRMLSALHADASRMLFRRGVNAIAHQRYDFAQSAAETLSENYGQVLRVNFLNWLAVCCRSSSLLQRAFSAMYRYLEGRIVKSRRQLLSQYSNCIRSK